MVGKVRFVAELGSSHNGSLLRALKLLDAAADAGFTAAKTQAWELEGLFRPEAIDAIPGIEERRKYELPLDWHDALYERSCDLGLLYGVTIFDPKTIPFIKADFWKVSSYDLLRLDLMRALGDTGKPTIISTGMATMAEVMEARSAFLDTGDAHNLTLLHCVSCYPLQAEQANLKAIDGMQKFCGQPIGWSDHSRSFIVVERAVWRWKATTVELHIDLDDLRGAESTGHVWNITAAEKLLENFRKWPIPPDIEREHPSDGHGRKEPMPCEEKERNWRADPEDGLRPLRNHIPCLVTRTASSSSQASSAEPSGQASSRPSTSST